MGNVPTVQHSTHRAEKLCPTRPTQNGLPASVQQDGRFVLDPIEFPDYVDYVTSGKYVLSWKWNLNDAAV